MKVRKVCDSLRLNAAQVDELALQCGAVSERGFNARFHTAVNLSLHSNRNFMPRLSSVSELQYNARTDPKDKVTKCIKTCAASKTRSQH